LLTNQKIKTETRGSLYFGEYKYCLKFYMPDVYTLRYRSHIKIDELLTWNQNRKINWGGSWQDPFAPDGVSEHLHELLYLIDDMPEGRKLTVTRNNGYLYTNSLDAIETVSNLEYTLSQEIKQVDLAPAGTMKLKNPQYAYRTYFKNQRLRQEDKERLAEFLKTQAEVRTGPGFNDFLENWTNYCYVQQNHFVDHNDLGVITMLQLVCPIKIKKTLELISDK